MDRSNTPVSPKLIPTQDDMDLESEPLGRQGNKYEVVLSFSRSEDTQESFASLLYSSLRRAGISVFKDDILIEVSGSIIEDSEISIIIFSEHYVSSRRCLEELTKLMEFRRAHDHVVVPIFYGVDPFDVRNQKSNFRQAFRGFMQRISPIEDELSRWSTALNEAGGNYGFFVPNSESKTKSEIIDNIVQRVRHILDNKGPFPTYGLVGVSSQVKEVITMLQKHKSKDVVSIGIWGMGGIGKTTLARLIFEHIQHEFESTCFLSNDRETWQRPKPEKVLLVLDDVNLFDQLDGLRRQGDWFGQGSRIIITTRDLHLLKAFGVDFVYNVKLLSDHDSLQLFSRKAFKQESLEGEFIQLGSRVVTYTEGLPLALKVLGSFFCGRSLIEWKSALMKLSTVPYILYNALKPSFDSLDGNEKEIFLNIVSFHVGEGLHDVIQKLEAYGCNVHIGIRALVDRSLMTIDNNKLRMHNVLQLMGRQIICENSQNQLPNRGHKYEVFLSFKGGNSETTFTSHLYTALCNAGIIVYKDDVDLPRGNHIRTELLQAIGNSKIAIIIFSKEYAGSKWCLEELSIIIELHKSNDQVVLPIFYDVDPLEIRNQSSSFGEVFKDLVQRISPPEFQVHKWRSALCEAGGISGVFVLGSRDESENVKVVVENVKDILDKKDLFVADHPVGMENCIQEVISLLQNDQSEAVVMVGIWGIGGIGKSTIAKAIYNDIGRRFESRSYLPNIRDVWDQEEGQVRLQNQLLSEICMISKLKINNVESGKVTLSDRLRHKKALVVLDDVDKLAQLNALVGSRDWYKRGSRIIITTRKKHLLRKIDCHVYIMKNLDERESIKLFSWHAFKQESPKEDFFQLSKDIAAYSGGLPLVLGVLGSCLFCREAEEWKRVLKKLQIIPSEKIQKKLKISFNNLDNLEKEIFLDISCFFIGMDRKYVTHILNGCELLADIGIKTLEERSLVTTDEKNKLGMHNLLRDMGREIIHKKSQNELGKRSRLWFHKDALAVLLKHIGTKDIEGLSMKLSQNEKMHFQTEAFKKMKRLRLLRLDNVQLRGDYRYISRNLRWLCWHGFPIKYIPSNFYQKKLVVMDLKYSSLKQVWKEPLLLERLKILNLSHSPYLVETPDFSKLPNLEKLILKDCPSLSRIDSIGLLDKLLLLDLEDCIGLCILPRSIYRLKCLKTLILSGCVMIEKLEEDIEQMESLTTLIAPTVKQVPFSLVRLKSILYLSICGYEGLSHHVITSLYRSWMSPTNNPPPLIPTHVGMSSSVLCSSSIHSGVSKQQSLLLEDEVLEIPHSSYAPYKDISRLEKCLGHLLINIGKNSQVFHTLSEKILQGLDLTKHSDDCVLPGDNYPYWLTFKGEGASVKFKVPQVDGGDHLKGMIFCGVYFPLDGFGNKACDSYIISLMILNYTKATTLLYKEDKLTLLEEAEWKQIISTLEIDDQVEVKAEFGNGLIVKKTAVYLIYSESLDEQMEPSQSKALLGTKRKCEKEDIERLLWEMRRETIHEHFHEKLGKKSRLCSYEDALAVSSEHMVRIKTLERSLVTTDEKNKLEMHDLSQDMGKEVLCTLSQNKLGKRSRLKSLKDTGAALSKHVVTRDIEGLSMKLSQREDMYIQLEAFQMMKKLKPLRFYNVQLQRDYKYIIPSYLYLPEVVFIDLKNSSHVQVRKEPPVLIKLKILNLSHSACLVETPDFSKLPNLEELILKDCPKLSMIHPSIGLLKKLLLLDLEDCISLCSLPRSIFTLKCLKVIILSGCLNIQTLEDRGQINSSTILIWTHHLMLPRNHLPPPIPIHDALNSVHGPPSTIPSSLPKQHRLFLEDGLKIPHTLWAPNCMDISRFENSVAHILIRIGKNCQVFRTLSETISQRLNLTKDNDDCFLPGDNYPSWLTFKSVGASVKFKVPVVNDRDHLKGMGICCVYYPSGDLGSKVCESCIISLMIINYTKKTTLLYNEDRLTSMEKERKELVSNLEPDDQMEVIIILVNGFIAKKTAVYLIYYESFDYDVERSPSEATNSSGTKHK